MRGFHFLLSGVPLDMDGEGDTDLHAILMARAPTGKSHKIQSLGLMMINVRSFDFLRSKQGVQTITEVVGPQNRHLFAKGAA